jgi:hypothetical protein
MSKRILRAVVGVPDKPRVRFFRRTGQTPETLGEVTCQVASVAIEDLEDGGGAHGLLRLDAGGGLVWRTRHGSLKEALWYAQFEYDLPEDQWQKYTEKAAG